METKFEVQISDGRTLPVAGVMHIGREASNEIALNDAAASRHHATLWVENGKPQISDNKSANGVFVNNSQIPVGKPKALRPGDRIRIGQTDLVIARASQSAEGTLILPQPSTRSNLPMLACGGLLALGLIALAAVPLVGVFVLGWSLPGLTGPTPAQSPLAQVTTPAPFTLTPPPAVVNINVSAVTVIQPPPLIEPRRFGPTSDQLASAVAGLNRSQLDFVHTASSVTGYTVSKFLFLPVAAPRTQELDDKLLQVAADALQVAALAEGLAQTAAAQDGASEAALQIASHYNAIAQISAALVIEAQSLRGKLASGEITPLDAAQVIADYGARLWNPAVTDPAGPGNPFAASVGDPAGIPAPQPVSAGDVNTLLNLGAGLPPFWVAVSGEVETKTLSVPPSVAPPPDRSDPAVIQRLTTAAGQKADSGAAVGVAKAIIEAGGGADVTSDQPTGESVVASFRSAVAVASPATDSPAAQTLPAFPGGAASVVVVPPSDPNPIATLLGIDDGGTPSVGGQVPITATGPVVTLTISNISITQLNKTPTGGFNTFEAEVFYEFDVQWSTNLVQPRLELDCAGGNHFEITSASGSQRVKAKGLLILYPGAEDAYCYASRNGTTLGGASVRFLVGDADGATERANQVETDSVSLNLTLTADALGTLSAGQTSAAQTQAGNATSNAVATEVYGTQTAEFRATITEIAVRTASAQPPPPTLTPTATATFTPVLLETLFHPGDVFAISTTVIMQPGRLYRICLSGTVYLVNPDAAVGPDQIMHVNGLKVPPSGCVVIEGNGQVANITCGQGEPAEEPGGYTVTVTDLGPQ